MMRNLAVELARFNVRGNNVAPDTIKTPIDTKLRPGPELPAGLPGNIPSARPGKPEDMTGTAACLAGPDAGYAIGTTTTAAVGSLPWIYPEQ
ncbi:hypothetical protein CY652_20920 [Burkholderia sp. WAC0059]|uniref:SDR family oxidoreductase n=1 Tax=Burkholderia sp. WAC0059 TaxID=2066022 RepID=UPI000C7F15BD|nr:SDR family oxidoreductase [Burkholderia sp. WAC0059]PLZ00463.1 hypothetical protein CY652_20920 [Burkholderia sp. WAC0059]